MPTFSSAQVTSPFLSTSELLEPMAAFDTHQNQLYKQQSDQQQIGATDMAMVGRAAGSLLGMSETDAAAAYPGMIADLQRQGFAKNAPPTYPGHAAVQGLVQRGLTVPEQYQTGLLTAPGVMEALKGASAPLNFNGMPSGGGGGGGTATGAAATPGGDGSFLSALAQIESGDKNIVSGVDTDSQGRTAAQGGNAGEISQGHFQIQTATWRDFAKQAGVDINQYPNAMSAPREIQAQVASVIPFSRFGPRTQQMMRQRFGDFDSNRTVGDLAGLGPRVTPAAGAGAAPTQQAAPAAPPPPLNPNAGPRIANLPQPPSSPAPPGSDAAWLDNQARKYPGLAGPGGQPPVAPSPIALRTGGTDVAGPGAGQTTLPPVEAPNQLYQTGLPGVTINGPGNTLAPPGTAVAGNTAAPPIQPQPQPAPPQPAARPPATGVNSPQFQAAMELNRRAQMLDMVVDPTGRTKALAASLRAQAALYMQADSYQSATQDGLTGQRSQLTNKFEPYGARRLQKLDDGRIINDQGQVIGYAAPYKVEQDPNTHQPMYVPQYPTPPNLSAVPGAPSAGGMTGAVPVPGTTPDLGFAKEQEAEAGRLSKLRESIIEQARESGSANTMIQNTETAMADAQKGNIGPNAIAPDLLNVVATAKALGMNLKSFGIDDTKLAAAQVTREQLQQLNGAILRKMYPQRITNADLAVSGAALPNYGLDPAALTANFGIYKRQNAYDTAKAQDMLSYEREHGTLRGWEHEWYNKNNFAPGPLEGLFGDAKAGALAGGGGSGGPGGGSGTTQSAPGAPPATMLKDGVVTTFKNGQQWTLRNGQPAQVK